MALGGFLKLDDVEGEAQDSGHKDEIEFESLNWSAQSTSSALSEARRVRAQVDIEPLFIEKTFDKSSPPIVLALLNGTVYKEAEFVIQKDGQGRAADYLKFTLTNVKIHSYDINHDAGEGAGSLPMEIIGFEYEAFKIAHTEQNDDGSQGTETEIEYDLKKAKPV